MIDVLCTGSRAPGREPYPARCTNNREREASPSLCLAALGSANRHLPAHRARPHPYE